MNGGIRRAHSLTQVQGAAAVGIYLAFLFSFLSCFGLSLSFHFSAGMKGSGGELGHLAGWPRGGGDIRSCHTLLRVHTV